MTSDPSNSSSSSFILVGVPGLEAFPTCLGVLFCSAYVMALVGNGAVLLVTGLDKSLRAPCHQLLAMLAAVDVLMVTAVVPKLLSVLWLSSAEIGYVACFVQMFLVHSATSEESGLLLAMAIDRYVAICHPLRYHSILSARAVAQMGLAIVLRALLSMVPLTGLLTSLPYCGPRAVPHSYCEHQAVAGLACADPAPAGLYSVAASSLTVGADGACIAASYSRILRAVPGHGARRRALSTCGCHLCVVLLFYLPGIVSVYLQMSPSDLAAHVQVLVADLYLPVPPTLNPLVYGIKVKQIQEGTLRLLGQLAGLRFMSCQRQGRG
ncbi:olfactory receptor 52I2-like [Chiroxiphia lanceolata]|uniref:olfactory receptor 52I2-like n=1 Tax=Chiroxiphia lanceolata TaxID=296741 RepID=UPI0013CE7A34|nr:olfactory receptor 52I2-like [Chiroxiphia lanceolata]